MYFDTGDLSTLEYLYDFKWIRASSEMHSATACSVPPTLLAATSTKKRGTIPPGRQLSIAPETASHQPPLKRQVVICARERKT